MTCCYLNKDLEKNINSYKTKRKVPKVIYCLRYCFLLTKNCMHNEVWGYTEILPVCDHSITFSTLRRKRLLKWHPF